MGCGVGAGICGIRGMWEGSAGRCRYGLAAGAADVPGIPRPDPNRMCLPGACQEPDIGPGSFAALLTAPGIPGRGELCWNRCGMRDELWDEQQIPAQLPGLIPIPSISPNLLSLIPAQLFRLFSLENQPGPFFSLPWFLNPRELGLPCTEGMLCPWVFSLDYPPCRGVGWISPLQVMLWLV